MKVIKSYQDKKVLVLGLGKSGINAAKLLAKLGAKVTVNDLHAPKDPQVIKDLTTQGIKVITGSHPLELAKQNELMVKNPGIPYSNPLVEAAQAAGLPIITEPELAYEILDSPLVAVTGTNGKTTTTTLITLMLDQDRTAGRAYSAGNIGIPASQVAQKATTNDVMVAELSSFQLLGITQLRPHVAVITNIYEAHTDYHGSRANYVKAKLRITKNQTAKDYLIINWDSEEWRNLSQKSAAQVIPFSRKTVVPNGAYQQGEYLYFKGEKIIKASDIKIPGSHNIENALAAIAAAKIMGQNNQAICQVLRTFSGVKHRIQYVMTVNQRKFYNDSKATNIEACERALGSFDQPIVLLAGGLDRGFTFERLIPDFKHVRAMICFGETAKLMAAAGEQAGIKQIEFTQDVISAVPLAYQLSQPGDVVLLSPACASWDQYPTFEVRGDRFINAIEKLATEQEEK
ncbi:MAG: UDP-N-acetylmuramoyl-L-alanine--D-glutamate ligase [Liquorilactobacillus nagelii]|jgi:UDP-N-acetylmuramoylalanine--D-glutamate ligase|uniref:UDP-N-acetylmuramoyl-L-alanine--D-glutamate ligase n=1 Tax=Liquorilactobacillus nagelii TaxID=82688 RepID=UPI002432004C|nr:UDP-N-acetylmuramoyl-L-alanine--D-glutamate ligase [Liquorilactobacillus nagelii]MCI1634469.1 UDP-N-acetylmuramoyl-L-alanine--D-glutamate ligase [Liquorilactobacillus nagelii]MCI1920384.1 UDP-N-acetylmuramoyl-L-alanine--D-glutamate ligase [Liquorilactobacillus nagelii]MCI1976028.1 UDP-N-acetylmuramoyl-L-alanine--D-glutamate ligase [Liquorilactobacillus nagelii]